MGQDFRTQRANVRDRAQGFKTLEDLAHEKRVKEQRAIRAEAQEKQARTQAALGVPLFGEVQ